MNNSNYRISNSYSNVRNEQGTVNKNAISAGGKQTRKRSLRNTKKRTTRAKKQK